MSNVLISGRKVDAHNLAASSSNEKRVVWLKTTYQHDYPELHLRGKCKEGIFVGSIPFFSI